MLVERRVNAKGPVDRLPSFSGMQAHLPAVGPQTMEVGLWDLFGLFPGTTPDEKKVVNWAHLLVLPDDPKTSYTVSVSSGIRSLPAGGRDARSKAIVSASNPHGSITYVLTPEPYSDHPPGVPFSRLPKDEQQALRAVLGHFVLSNPHFSSLSPSSVLGEKKLEARSEDWSGHVVAEAVRVKHWLQEALRLR